MPLDFRNKCILAPMVRVGTLPMRLLALKYGADIVYSEEIVDLKMLDCHRIVNETVGTVDFVIPGDAKPIFRVHPNLEGDKLVFQMGTNNAERALKVAKMVEADVAAVDVNMGCPKPFSVHAGMGAALLDKPDQIKEILTNLVSNFSKPVTCKIRLLPRIEDTVKLVKLIEQCGVSAIAIHGRTRHERQHHPNRNQEIKAIVGSVSVPVIANGGSTEIFCHQDIDVFRRSTGCSSVMIARAAISNPSIFCKESTVSVFDLAREYIKNSADLNCHPTNVKYVVLRMLGDQQQACIEGKETLKVITLRQICRVWDLEPYLLQARQKQRQVVEGQKKSHILHDKHVTTVSLLLPKKNFEGFVSPRATLNEWCRKRRIDKPTFVSVQRDNDKYFQSTVKVNSKEYKPDSWEKNRKRSEQAASMAALDSLNLRHLLPQEFWDA